MGPVLYFHPAVLCGVGQKTAKVEQNVLMRAEIKFLPCEKLIFREFTNPYVTVNPAMTGPFNAVPKQVEHLQNSVLFSSPSSNPLMTNHIVFRG